MKTLVATKRLVLPSLALLVGFSATTLQARDAGNTPRDAKLAATGIYPDSILLVEPDPASAGGRVNYRVSVSR